MVVLTRSARKRAASEAIPSIVDEITPQLSEGAIKVGIFGDACRLAAVCLAAIGQHRYPGLPVVCTPEEVPKCLTMFVITGAITLTLLVLAQRITLWGILVVVSCSVQNLCSARYHALAATTPSHSASVSWSHRDLTLVPPIFYFTASSRSARR